MIELTVKTLDSQNHLFSVPDDVTVKQLKEKIAESIPIPADVQRLIYCGRVLQDDRNLSDYDVNGKVIHLVQRPPPSATRPDGNSPPRSTTASRHRHPRVDGNAMYLGAMAFPADLMDAQGIHPPQPSNGLSQSRLNLALRMLNRAKRVLDKLENPEQQESPDTDNIPSEETENASVSDDNPAAAASSNAVGVDESSVGIENVGLNGTVTQVAQAATAAAIAAAVSAAQGIRLPIVTGARGRQNTQESSANEAAGNAEGGSDEIPTDDVEAPGGGAAAADRRRRQNTPRTTAMADTLDELHQVQNRLQPFLQRYTTLMREDTPFENDPSGVQESQRIFNLVSEVMHYISHAFHALSDIMCDFNSAPPRQLRCRPVLIQHSAVLQAGIPIQAQFNLTTSRGSNAAPASSESQAGATGAANNQSSNVTSTTVPQPPTAAAAATVAAEETTGIPVSQSAESRTSTSRSENVSQDRQNPQAAPRTRRIFAAGGSFPSTAFNISPGNVEVFMEVGPTSITIDSVEATIMGNNGSGSADSGSGQSANNMPWGPTTPEFIQNIMQAVAGHMMGHANNHVTEPSSTSSSSNQQANASTNASGQNSQARGNTATHPTTSTQTRSTSRPHVHFAPTAVQSLASTNFDPFLPCNSHHIKVQRRNRQRGNHGPSFGQFNVDIQGSGASAFSETQSPRPPFQSQSETNTEQQGSASPSQQNENRQEAASQSRSSSDFSRFMESIFSSVPPAARAFMASVASQDSSPHPGVFFVNASDEGRPQITSVYSLGGSGRNVNDNTSTLADVLSFFSDNSYVQGESLFTDLIMIMARNITFEDIVNLSISGQARINSLNRLRPHLRDFVTQRLLEGQSVSEGSISRGTEQLISELIPHILPLQNARVRQDVDLVATLIQYHERRFPEILTIITTEGADENFGNSLITWSQQYVQDLVAIVKHCCIDDEALENILRGYMNQLTSGVHPVVHHWTMIPTIARVRNYIRDINVPLERITTFLIPRTLDNTSSSTTSIPVQAEASVKQEPMDTDSTHAQDTTRDIRGGTSVTNGEIEANVFSTVTFGSESWHHEVSPDWVPVITRDIQTQRRQSPQRPFSDAYLSGMPPKRRKVVTTVKEQGNLTQIISETVRSAAESVQVNPVINTGLISEAAGSDPVVQTAYREEVRKIVENNLIKNPDFSAEKFPNAARFLKKK